MFCPECGTKIEPRQRPGPVEYPPCPGCEITWEYDGEEGCYRVQPLMPHTRGAYTGTEHIEEPLDIEGALRHFGADSRGIALDVLVGNIVDTMEEKALAEGQCTYYMGTYAVARETLITASLTCERDPSYHGLPPTNRLRWVSFMGDDYEYLTRRQAIEILLVERS